MKTIIILNIFMMSAFSFSQQQRWVNDYTFTGYNDITQIQFLNSNTGWVSLEQGNQVIIAKTTDKGRSWNWICSFGVDLPSPKTFFVFTDESYGYRAHSESYYGGSRTVLEKTIDGGSTWSGNLISFSSVNGEQPLIIFRNSTEGYLYLSEYESLGRVFVYHTTDRFANVQDISSGGINPPYQRHFVLNDILFDPNGNIFGVGHNKNGENGYYGYWDFFNLLYTGNFLPQYGTSYHTYLRFLYGAFVNNSVKYIGTQSDDSPPYHLPGTRFYPDFNEQNSILIDPQTGYDKVGGLSFSDGSKGFTTVDNHAYITNNSGNSWTQEWTFGNSVHSWDGHHRVKSFGDVCYAAVEGCRFYTRKIIGTFNTNYDWQGGTPGNIVLDGENFNAPEQHYYKGGTCVLSATQYFTSGNPPDTTKRFYYWGGSLNASMNSTNSSQYLIYDNSNINADYKTKLKTREPTALWNANQVKALKDTNGVVNLLYESMGGIFYTRTRPEDGNFKAEEICSETNYATFGNTNPYLAEIKRGGSSIDREKNVNAVWERREDNNIKILYGERTYTHNPQTGDNYFWWYNYNPITISNAPPDFQCFPKLFVARIDIGVPIDLKIITYRKPDPLHNNVVKIYASVYRIETWSGTYDLTPNIISDVLEYSIVGIDNLAGPQLHLAYKIGNNIKYSHYAFVADWGYSAYNLGEDYTFSNDNSPSRFSPDITLKNQNNSGNPNNANMQPVVTYQGQYSVVIYLDNGGGGEPEQVNGTYYPIFVRERVSTPNGWSSGYFIYNSLNTPQHYPNIEGSKLMNSCMLNFSRGSTYRQVVPRWNGSTIGNTCDPNQFPGTDAKFIKCGLVYSFQNTQTLMTLSPDNSIFQLGRQDFVIGPPANGGFDEINGIILNDNVKYSFNLGSISVNWNDVGFYTDIDTTITDGSEFNNCFTSRTFGLHENDTLVIGRDAFYIVGDSVGNFHQMEYWVKLMNKTTEQMQQLLAHDTVQTGDTIETQYLEGFIVHNIPGGFDSFYVKLEVDTLGTADGYGIGAGSTSGPGGYNFSPNRKIFWGGKNIHNKYKEHLKPDGQVPTTFNLYQNYPNPFNPTTKIKFDLPKDVNVTIKIYDILGRETAVLLNNEFRKAGRYEAVWNGQNFASGIYFYRIEARQAGSSTVSFVTTKKMVLVK